MLGQARIAVVVPAYQEERLIARTLDKIPDFVDSIWVVNDASTDRTAERATATSDARVVVVSHSRNRGVGAAIVTGYLCALAAEADVIAVVAGDDQMDPEDLESVIAPVVEGRADYVKGNRFLHTERRRMPLARRAAGRVLSAMTRLATGLAVDDCQCGYAALSARAARDLPILELWPRFGYPNDLLGMLAARRMRVSEVPVRPVYAGERSGVRPWHVFVVGAVIARRAWRDRKAKGSRVKGPRSSLSGPPLAP